VFLASTANIINFEINIQNRRLINELDTMYIQLLYQEEGYCNLETAAQITSASNSKGCHHYRTKEIKEQPEQNSTKL